MERKELLEQQINTITDQREQLSNVIRALRNLNRIMKQSISELQNEYVELGSADVNN